MACGVGPAHSCYTRQGLRSATRRCVVHQYSFFLPYSTYLPANTAAAPNAVEFNVVVERDKNKSRATLLGTLYANCVGGASRRECNQLVAFFMLLPATTLRECIRGRVYITPGSILQVRLMAQVLGMYRFTTPLLTSPLFTANNQHFLNTVLVI